MKQGVRGAKAHAGRRKRGGTTMLNSEQRRERDTGDGQQGKMFLVLWELSFKKAEAFGYFRPTKVPRRRQRGVGVTASVGI